ncbi:MAG: S41 family peptidase [Bacteroidota bacterium]
MRVSFLCLLLMGGLVASSYGQTQSLYQHLMRFSSTLNHVQDNYVDTPPPAALIDAAIAGVLSSLDPHSIYVPSSESAAFQSLLAGERAGLGLEVTILNGQPVVMGVLPDSPASKARLRPGDILISIDDQVVADRAAPDVRLRLSGEVGSKVRLEVQRHARGDQREERFTKTLKREMLDLPSVALATLLNDTTAYVRLSHFAAHTATEALDALQPFRKAMRYLILDLRDNPGGTMQSAVDLVDHFVTAEQTIVELRGRKAEATETLISTKKTAFSDLPLAVLLNASSASASEVVAGSLQDLDRALVLGTRSFGKGLVQSPFLLADGSMLMMTIARYHTPSGRLIQRPYTGLTAAEYYLSLQRQQPDTTQAFQTRQGRTVYGGGGIQPDVWVAPADSAVVAYELAQQADVLEAAQRVLADAPVAAASPVGFWQQRHAQAGYTAALDVLSAAYAEVDRTLVDRALGHAAVQLHWDRAHAFRLFAEADPVVQAALAQYPRAQMLARP